MTRCQCKELSELLGRVTPRPVDQNLRPLDVPGVRCGHCVDAVIEEKNRLVEENYRLLARVQAEEIAAREQAQEQLRSRAPQACSRCGRLRRYRDLVMRCGCPIGPITTWLECRNRAECDQATFQRIWPAELEEESQIQQPARDEPDQRGSPATGPDAPAKAAGDTEVPAPPEGG